MQVGSVSLTASCGPTMAGWWSQSMQMAVGGLKADPLSAVRWANLPSEMLVYQIQRLVCGLLKNAAYLEKSRNKSVSHYFQQCLYWFKHIQIIAQTFSACTQIPSLRNIALPSKYLQTGLGLIVKSNQAESVRVYFSQQSAASSWWCLTGNSRIMFFPLLIGDSFINSWWWVWLITLGVVWSNWDLCLFS